MLNNITWAIDGVPPSASPAFLFRSPVQNQGQVSPHHVVLIGLGSLLACLLDRLVFCNQNGRGMDHGVSVTELVERLNHIQARQVASLAWLSEWVVHSPHRHGFAVMCGWSWLLTLQWVGLAIFSQQF